MSNYTYDEKEYLFGIGVIEIDTSSLSEIEQPKKEEADRDTSPSCDEKMEVEKVRETKADEKEDLKNKEIYEEGLSQELQPYVEQPAESSFSEEEIRISKRLRWKKRGIRLAVVLCILTGMYLTFVYSDIPFIAKWRTIYIETAMTTNSHQWLATLFFPKSVIDEVMAARKQSFKDQADITSTWEDEGTPERNAFYTKYWELDSSTFHKYLEKHPGLLINGYEKLKIKDLEGKLGLKTVKGDTVLVVDIANNLLIIGVKGEGYQGKLAIVKDSSQITLGKSKALGSYGQEIDSFCKDYDAILGINASGFVDVDGVGTGGQVNGCLVIDGVDYGRHYTDAAWKFFGFKENDRMYITNYTSGIEKEYRWGMEFFPALIVDGKNVVDGTYGMGIQPRSAFGQTKDGDVLMLVVDGRQVGYSIGCTVQDCSDILFRYQAYQAMNLDGGSSSVMYYDGEFITSSSSVTGRGRYMPDAFLVTKASKEAVIEAEPGT